MNETSNSSEVEARIASAYARLVEQKTVGSPPVETQLGLAKALVGGAMLDRALQSELRSELVGQGALAHIFLRAARASHALDEETSAVLTSVAEPAARIWTERVAVVEAAVRFGESGRGVMPESFDIDSFESRLVFKEYPQLAGRLGLGRPFVSEAEIDDASEWLDRMDTARKIVTGSPPQVSTPHVRARFTYALAVGLRQRRQVISELLGDGFTSSAKTVRNLLIAADIAAGTLRADPVLSDVSATLYGRRWAVSLRATEGPTL